MKKVESKDDAKNLALIQQLNELKNIWKSQENSRRRCSSASDHSITSFDNFSFQISSPRTLMSFLQHRKPAFRVKNCSNAVEEILMDRRAAITSGRFKGRQLFVAAEEESALTHSYSGGGSGEICSDWINGIQEREVMMNYHGSGDDQYDKLSSDFSESCSLPEEKLMVVEEKAVVEVAEAVEKRGGGGDGRRKEKGGGGGGRKVATASLGVVLIVFALVLFSISCNGNNVEFILVPT